MQRLCVFCGSARGARPAYASAAQRFGTALAARGTTLVFGGASVGLMGVLADAVLDAGGSVVGVIPRPLVEREIAHQGCTTLHTVDTMHERKALMADLAHGFVALPGGFGTLDELFEVVTWGQLGMHRKPVGLLNTAGFFDPLLAMLDHLHRERFAAAPNRDALAVEDDPERLLDLLGRAA